MFQQKSRVLVLALLVLLSWAPLATAAETTGGGFFDGLMQQLAVYLGLADEAGPDWSPGGFTEAGPNFSPGGQPSTTPDSNEAGPDWVPGGFDVPNNEAGPSFSPGG